MLNTLLKLIQIFPVIIAAVRLVEDLSKTGDWTSQDKKAAALKIVRDLAASFGLTVSDGVIDVLSKVIDTIVSVLNAFGVFTKSSKVEAVSPEVVAEAVQAVVSGSQAVQAVVNAASDPHEARFDHQALADAEAKLDELAQRLAK